MLYYEIYFENINGNRCIESVLFILLRYLLVYYGLCMILYFEIGIYFIFLI